MQIEIRAFKKSEQENSGGSMRPVGHGVIEGVDPNKFPSASTYAVTFAKGMRHGAVYGFDQCTPDRLEFSCRAWPELHGTWLRLPDGWEKGGGNG